MEKLIDEIKTHFATGMRGLRRIKCLNEWGAFTYRQNGEFGLAIKFDSEKDVYEEANEVVLYTTNLTIGQETERYLMLACCDEQYRNKFAELSRDFVEPGENGEARKILLGDPYTWWNNWVGLLGDRKTNRKCYDTIAEMLALDYLYSNDNSTVWMASEAGTHDIETNTNSFEVKSTIKKSETTVSISSQHQLESSNQLYLIYFRMEKSLSGYSINDVAASLVSHGYDVGLLESQLENRGFKKGSSIRDMKYTVLETRNYTVDSEFPKIVKSSFKNDTFPKNVIKILYTIDLAGIPYISIMIDKKDESDVEINYKTIMPQDFLENIVYANRVDEPHEKINKQKIENKIRSTKTRLIPDGSILESVLEDDNVTALIKHLMSRKEGTSILKIVAECEKEFQLKYFSMDIKDWKHIVGDFVRGVTQMPNLKEEEVFTFKVA